jgi:transposase InsO family protein
MVPGLGVDDVPPQTPRRARGASALDASHASDTGDHRPPGSAAEPGLELGHHLPPTVVRGRFLRLYLVIDVWSRRIVGWEVHTEESAERAALLIQRICADTGVDLIGLVLHADNGKPNRGSTMIATLQ